MKTQKKQTKVEGFLVRATTPKNYVEELIKKEGDYLGWKKYPKTSKECEDFYFDTNCKLSGELHPKFEDAMVEINSMTKIMRKHGGGFFGIVSFPENDITILKIEAKEKTKS